MARSNAERRLIRILMDSDYGPKLARLRGEDEKRILRLIDQNKGREARREIVRADEQRRARESAKRQAKRQPPPRAPSSSSRQDRERKAIRNILQRLGVRAKRTSVTKNVKFMTDDELEFAKDADTGSLVDRASEPPYVSTRKKNDFNPFWYH